MQTCRIGSSDLTSSRLVYGCMRIAGEGAREDLERGKRALRAAVDAGYTQFDHADIYGHGRAESLFGEFLRDNPSVRDRIVIASKCGVRRAGDPEPDAPARYDFSQQHILSSVEGSLSRLRVENLDILMLHRPDFLMRPDDVAESFERLQRDGKVAHFGVSNFSPSQVTLLQSALATPLIVNQIEINLHNVSALTDGTLDQCQELTMTPQAWCPLAVVAYPAWGNTLSATAEARIRHEVEQQAKRYGADHAAIALAWLVAHPAGIMPLVGSTTPERIAAATRALTIDYAREDWYRLLEARNGARVP